MLRRLFPLFAVVVLLAGCGGAKRDPAKPGPVGSAALRAKLAQATTPAVADFPPTASQTLQQVANSATSSGPQVGLATSVFTPGTNRLAFGVIDAGSSFLYGKTAVYVARGSTNSPAQGPFLAPADLLITDPPYRSRQAATEKDAFAAVYAAQVEFSKPGTWYVLVMTKQGSNLIGAQAQVKVIPASRDTVPRVGSQAPAVDTDTVASAGSINAIDTRIPHDDMHDTNLRDVLGKKPVILLFATPQLCQSRVCGPVTDIAQQLKQKYGDKATFIHQEVYVDNQVNKGLRPSLRRFGLETEPWLFAINADGKIVDRLEGSFGFGALNQAARRAIAG